MIDGEVGGAVQEAAATEGANSDEGADQCLRLRSFPRHQAPTLLPRAQCSVRPLLPPCTGQDENENENDENERDDDGEAGYNATEVHVDDQDVDVERARAQSQGMQDITADGVGATWSVSRPAEEPPLQEARVTRERIVAPRRSKRGVPACV